MTKINIPSFLQQILDVIKNLLFRHLTSPDRQLSIELYVVLLIFVNFKLPNLPSACAGPTEVGLAAPVDEIDADWAKNF
jgi:hypothetical protein